MARWVLWTLAGLVAACHTSNQPTATPAPHGQILYLTGSDEAPSLRQTKPSGADDRAVFTDADRAYAYGVHPKTDQLLLVVAKDGVDQIALGDLRSGKTTLIAPSSELSWYPELSSDGRTILFESARASFRDLYRYNLDGGVLERLTDNVEGNFDAKFSPDGRHIAFASSRHGQLDVFVMNADGSGQRRITHHLGDSVKPAWSFDGRYIAFISGRDGQDALFRVRPDGTELQKLSAGIPAGHQVTSFQFHPAAPRLVFSAQNQTVNRVYVVDVKGEALHALSSLSARDSEPVWSPSGDGLAFTVTEGARSDVWIMDPSGERRRRVTQRSGPGGWRPRWIVEKGSRGHDALTSIPQPGIGNHHDRLCARREV